MDSNEIRPMSLYERARLGYRLLATALPAIGLATSSPVYANAGMSGAEKLYRLNAMLLATGQLCRSTPDNFTVEYDRFANNHVVELTRTEAEFRAELAARYGGPGGNSVLDRINRSMVNSYTNGHPWLDCAQLKMATRNLNAVIGRETLEEAADQLIGDSKPSQFADVHP